MGLSITIRQIGIFALTESRPRASGWEDYPHLHWRFIRSTHTEKMLPFLWIIRGENARATWQSEMSGTVASRGLCTAKNLATGISAQKQPLLRYAALHTYFLTDTIDEPLSHRRNLRSS